MQKVAGDLLAHELVVRQITIDDVDNPVAVAPRLRDRMIGVLAGGVGIADEVQPVPSPALAVVWRLQEAVNNRLISQRRAVGKKGLDFFHRGREARQIVGGPANERLPVSLGRRGESCDLQPGDDKSIDVVADAGRFAHGRTGDVTERLKRPPLAQLPFGQPTAPDVGRARIDGAALHPFGEQGNLSVRQLAAAVFGRHLRTVVAIADRLNQQALVDFSGNDSRSAFAPIFPAGRRIESQAALRLPFGGRMTRFAAMGEDRPDILLEEFLVVGAERLDPNENGEGEHEAEGIQPLTESAAGGAGRNEPSQCRSHWHNSAHLLTSLQNR